MDAGLPDPLKFLENSVEQKLKTDDARQVGTYTITSYKGLQFDDIARGFRVSDEDKARILGRNQPATTIQNAAEGITGGVTFIQPIAFQNSQYTIEEVIAHELMHGMGKKGYYYSSSTTGKILLGPLGSLVGKSMEGHDLKYMGNDYNRIIEACK